MLVSGIVVVLTAFCGYAAGVGQMLVNIEKVDVVNKQNDILGKWTATLTEGKPLNKVTMKTPLISDITADQLMLKLKAEMNGSPLPEYEKLACESLDDELIGKSVVKSGNPFIKKCPAVKDEYGFANFTVNSEKLPPTLPEGKVTGSVEIGEVGKDAVVIINFEATISRDVGGLG